MPTRTCSMLLGENVNSRTENLKAYLIKEPFPIESIHAWKSIDRVYSAAQTQVNIVVTYFL